MVAPSSATCSAGIASRSALCDSASNQTGLCPGPLTGGPFGAVDEDQLAAHRADNRIREIRDERPQRIGSKPLPRVCKNDNRAARAFDQRVDDSRLAASLAKRVHVDVMPVVRG